ncbi:MAG: peptidylprolyl isomerase [Gammaproteobacteria bacterium]
MSRIIPLLCLAACLLPSRALADLESARLAMENPAHPLLSVLTVDGAIFIELLPSEAPANVANVVALARGAVQIRDVDSGRNFSPNYYDGMEFHRVLPGFLIQAGSPALHPLGAPGNPLRDEINAGLLGLNLEPAMDEQGHFNPRLNIHDKQSLHRQLLAPLYDRMNINSAQELLQRQDEVLSRLQQMTMQQAYENMGYSYQDDLPGRAITRGTVALANAGANGNGPEFFIALQDAPWLNGRHTVIGRVVEGMNVADVIGQTAVDPLSTNSTGTRIYTIRNVNPE